MTKIRIITTGQILTIITGIALLVIFRNYITGIIERLIFLYLFISLAIKIDGRIAIGGGMILLLGTAIMSITTKSDTSIYQIAIFAYYFLVIGAITLFVEQTKKDKKMYNSMHTHDVIGIENANNIIAIISGKDGTGKTTVAANFGVALSKLGKKVAIIDMDLAMPNLEIITGLRDPSIGLIDVLEGRSDLGQAIYTGPIETKIIPPGIMHEGYNKEEHKEEIIKLLKKISMENDYVILDMPAGRESIDMLYNGIDVFVVANPDKASISDTVNMKIIIEKKDIKILGMILNKSEHNTTLIDEIERILEISVVTVIPESKIIGQAFNDEECIVVTEPESIASKEFIELANEMIIR